MRKYKVRNYLDRLIEVNKSAEVTLDEESKGKLKKSLKEYANDDYVTFDQVFEKGDGDV